MPNLNPHQHRLAQLRLSGQTLRQIARGQGVCEKTIKYHFGKIYKELQCSDLNSFIQKYYDYRKMKGLSPLPETHEAEGYVYFRIPGRPRA